MFNKHTPICDFEPEITISVNDTQDGKTITINALSGDKIQNQRTLKVDYANHNLFKLDISDIEIDLIKKEAHFTTNIIINKNNNSEHDGNNEEILLFNHCVNINIDEKKSKIEQIEEIKNEIKEIALEEFSYAIQDGFGYESIDDLKTESGKELIKKFNLTKLVKFFSIILIVLVLIFVAKLIFKPNTVNTETINQELPALIEQQTEVIQTPQTTDDIERDTLSEFGLEPDVALK